MLRFGLLICVCLFFLGCALLFAFGSAGSPCFQDPGIELQTGLTPMSTAKWCGVFMTGTEQKPLHSNPGLEGSGRQRRVEDMHPAAYCDQTAGKVVTQLVTRS